MNLEMGESLAALVIALLPRRMDGVDFRGDCDLGRRRWEDLAGVASTEAS
jgi:hypothetical protein